MLFPPSSVPRVFPSPLLLVFAHDVSGGSRVKSCEETLIGSDFSLSRAIFLLFFILALASRSLLERASSPVGLECSRKYFRVRPIRRRENPAPALWIFAPFSKTLVHLSARLADPFPFGPWCQASVPSLWLWNFPSSRSLSDPCDIHAAISLTLSASIYRISRFSNARYYISACN